MKEAAPATNPSIASSLRKPLLDIHSGTDQSTDSSEHTAHIVPPSPKTDQGSAGAVGGSISEGPAAAVAYCCRFLAGRA